MNLASELSDGVKYNKKYADEALKVAYALKDLPILSLPYSEYRGYYEKGSRVGYEEAYQSHRRMLCAFTAATLVEGGDWYDCLCDIIWAVCDEYTWALPAHIPAITDEDGALNAAAKIDLFASETAFGLAEIHHVLGDKLPKAVTSRIEFELERRIFEPYMKLKPTWGKSNWAAVCAGSVASAMILMGKGAYLAELEENFASAMENFLASFTDDGCCLEGSLYWSYGFMFFCLYAEILREYTDGRIDYFEDEKVRKIAFFGMNMRLCDDKVIPFSDSPHELGFDRGLLALLARRYEAFAIPDAKYENPFDDGSRYRFPVFFANLFAVGDGAKMHENAPSVTYYPDAGWYINRRSEIIFAAKAGHNAEPHNHNDVASFVIVSDGEFILDDPGWPEYDAFYFGPKRYDNICASSLGHSLPIIGGAQVDGSASRGEVLEVGDDSFALEYSRAYGYGSLKRLERSFKLSDRRVIITDHADGVESFTSRFVTKIEPELCDGGVILRGERSTWRLLGGQPTIGRFEFKPRFTGFDETVGIECRYTVDFEVRGEKSFVLEKI